MKRRNLWLITSLLVIIAGCGKIEQPVSYAPVITFSNYAGNKNVKQPWIQHDTVVIGYFRQEFTVNIAAPNAIDEVVFTGPDTSSTIKEPFHESTLFNYQIMISRPCPDRTVDASWSYKVTDRAGKTSEKKVRVLYVDTFKISPARIGGSHMGFDLMNSAYVSPFDNSKLGLVDIQDTRTAKGAYSSIFLDYLSHNLHSSPESGTKFMKATGLDFSDLSINKAYLTNIFTNPSDSISEVNWKDVIICRLRNTTEYALLTVVWYDGTDQYYTLGYRKITE